MEELWKRRTLSILSGRGLIISPEDPDYEEWARASEYPCWIDGVYIRDVCDRINYDRECREREQAEFLAKMNPVKRFFWKIIKG